MFTSSMINEEVEAVVYKDFLEIRGRMEIAEDKFTQRVRRTSPGLWVLHSLQETHTFQTRLKNTWTVYFYYLYTTPTGVAKISSMIYTSLSGDEDTDYLLMNNLDHFRLKRVSSRFSRQYEERYIDPSQIQLSGLLPAIYFMKTVGDRKIAPHTPDTRTEEEKKDKYLFVSEQGTTEAKPEGCVETYLTFLESEQLGD